MRKILLLALLPLIAISLASCSKDDDSGNTSTNESALVGVWQESSYWDRTDWHTWGMVEPPVWEFKADKSYSYYDSTTDYRNGKVTGSGNWSLSDNYLTTGNHSRKYTFSADRQTLTWENVAILKRYK